ncbi:macrolide ABC transporter ATP-binding protein [Paenibacillus sp. 32O-W]|uniref:ABC transporter ATP-binding protein n=1 Tax=Paenibacillus sp. 32O-W TaxID=1695218 RepID=UPI0007225E0A|nr:ABC transporter ATP-binding protein [Paenibacillus sp. 32O-W]ALS28992.1 macrolide ABC transporter ATP-binding protein [Paenibacillus sp. 32O-W]
MTMTAHEDAGSVPMVKAERVTRVFGRGAGAVQALKGVDLEVPARSMVALRGRSGSGKTTLINLIGALDQPTDGNILFQGDVISSWDEKRRSALRRKRIGLVFQSFGLMPLMSAVENVEFGLRIAGVPASEVRARAREALEQVGMGGRMKHRPGELSGGEQQRVAIARAIAHRPVLLLADEPTAELDSKTGLQVIGLFRQLVQRLNMTVILTTHDPNVMEIMDRTFTLEDGRIV